MRIAINGCGIGGPTLAWWLKQYGHEPVLFEKAPVLRTGGYIIDFWGSGYDVAEEMGLIPTLREDAIFVDTLRSVRASGRPLSEMDGAIFDELAGGRYFSIARSDIARHLFEACRGVESHFGRHVTAVDEEDECVRVTLSDDTTERFDLLIGADGLHSAVRGAVFGPQPEFERPLGYHVAAFTIDGYRPRDENAYVQFTRPGRQISRAALGGDRTLILMVVRSEQLDREPEEPDAQKAALKAIFAGSGWETAPILAGLEAAEDFYFDRVSQIVMPDWSKGRVALVGDAAACISLLGGEGTGLAITEARVLAGEIDRAGGDHRTAFRRYREVLGPLLEKKQKNARSMGGFFAPKGWSGVAGREFLAWLISFRPLSKLLVGPMLGEKPDLPDYRPPATNSGRAAEPAARQGTG